MSFSASRLTCYALLSALEEDLRLALVEALPGVTPDEALPSDVLQEARRRMAKQPDLGTEARLTDVLPFVDFSETLHLIDRHKASLHPAFADNLPEWRPRIYQLLPIRNRVAHTRPLEIADLPTVQDLVGTLLRYRDMWPSLDGTTARIRKDPSTVLDMDIRFLDIEPDVSRHNLPLPDFDDTGLVGRASDEKKLLQMVRGPFPVISVVGDGGVGKTALALKTAYALLDEERQPFDAIVWTTAKAAQLTSTEVTRIEGAIRDSLGMLGAAARELAGSGAEINDPLAEVLAYMETFRVLLILDNLETVLDARLREFLSRLPNNSKVLITSRIGLGSLEIPLRLGPLEANDGVTLLRATARTRGVGALASAPQEVLERFIHKMRSHPLYIKWFVSVIQAGRRPEDALSGSGNFLDFCMSNVYEFLSDESLAALRCLQALPGRHSQAAIAELTDLPADALQEALAQLITTNFVSLQPVARGGGVRSEYELTEFARTYLDRRHALSQTQRTSITGRHSRILEQGARLASASVADPYGERSLTVGGPSDFGVAMKLMNAMTLHDRGDAPIAFELIQEAQILAPDYHESYRIEALLRDRENDIGGATQSYELALEHADGDPSCLYHAGRFFMRRAGDPKRGLVLLQQAARTRREDPVLQLEIVRGHIQCGDKHSALDGALGLLANHSDVAHDAAAVAFRAALELARDHLGVGEVAEGLERLEDVADVILPALKKRDDAYHVRLVQAKGLVSRASTLATTAYLRSNADTLGQRLGSVNVRGGEMEYSRVLRVFPEKGFGFLSVPGQRDLFFGRRSVVPSGAFDRLIAGSDVCYSIGEDNEGRPCAVRVLPVSEYDGALE
ncbi:NB-ARC domain-containing protein [Cellulomonas shaoxiangyii]|nr:NB-ARC domain-containing protein [Cellulomonas shaoxiangyii]